MPIDYRFDLGVFPIDDLARAIYDDLEIADVKLLLSEIQRLINQKETKDKYAELRAKRRAWLIEHYGNAALEDVPDAYKYSNF